MARPHYSLRLKKGNVCVECGNLLDTASRIGKKQLQPTKGAVSVCFYCRHVAIFKADGSLREPTVDECIELHNDPQLKRILDFTMHFPTAGG